MIRKEFGIRETSRTVSPYELWDGHALYNTGKRDSGLHFAGGVARQRQTAAHIIAEAAEEARPARVASRVADQGDTRIRLVVGCSWNNLPGKIWDFWRFNYNRYWLLSNTY